MARVPLGSSAALAGAGVEVDTLPVGGASAAATASAAREVWTCLVCAYQRSRAAAYCDSHSSRCLS